MMLNKLSLNTIGLNRIGLNRIGKPSRGSSGRPYIDPEVLSALKAVCICYGKSNDDPDRAIVKNLVDPDNPFIISNAAYKLNSGYGKYDIDFTIFTNKFNVDSLDAFKVILDGGGSLFRPYSTLTENYPSWKGKVTFNNSNFTGTLTYDYRDNSGKEQKLIITQDGIYQFPICYNTETGDGTFTGLFNRTNSAVTIEQIPSYQGAFVTDGVDDLITSTKTVQEMGITDEITVVSMVHQVKDTTNNVSFTNYIRGSINGYFRNVVNNYGKTGIYGYTSSDLRSLSVVNNILGDKNDYTSNCDNRDTIINGNFSVQGYSYNNSNNTGDFSSVAWYWTIIANKVLTTDQINQVIAYYNLDRCVEPTVLYDVKRQGLSNDTPDSDWYLKDFSKNSFDMSLFNFAKKGMSGVNGYPVVFGANETWEQMPTGTFTWNIDDNKLHITKALIAGNGLLFSYVKLNGSLFNVKEIPSFKIKVSGLEGKSKLWYRYLKTEDAISETTTVLENGTHELPKSYTPSDSLHDGVWIGFTVSPISEGVKEFDCDITIEVLSSHAGALCFDGVEDYGKVTGLPIYKDYTVVADYERIDIGNIEGIGSPPVLSKSYTAGQGSFIMNFIASTGNSIRSYSFGTENTSNFSDLARQIFYQSKYKNQGFDITAGTGVDGDSLWLGTARDNDSRFFNGAIYSLMSFPYSLSEFLIERQLKKHKLGTLYPDMVEWRPIYTSNVNDYTITKATYFDETGQHDLALGNHYPIGTSFRIYVKPSGAVDEVTSIKVNGVELTYDYIDSNYGYAFNGTLSSKSPQKIDITIDEYIRYEDIVQPYPSIVTLRSADESYVYTYGDKLKVGDTFKYQKSTNLLPEFYQLRGELDYNGVYVFNNNQLHTVEKTMMFEWSHSPLYIGGTNIPKCILSPSRLRIPNSSYKILGYIPDISGHGNHGKINNSAYAGMSGANGYLQNFSDWTKATGVTSTDSTIVSGSNLDATKGWVAYVISGTVIPTFKVQISGIPTNGNLRFEGSDQSLANGVNTIQGLTASRITGFYISSGQDNDWSNLVIEQIGEYEGAYCLDGVDDFIEIPTTVGGKQVLLKYVWDSACYGNLLYDQRTVGVTGSSAILVVGEEGSGEDSKIAYYARNANGKTYIDGILNEYIHCSSLIDKVHNITITNPDDNDRRPVIGASNRISPDFFSSVKFYDFMLFDEISTDEEILTLNEYVGIEGNTDDLFTENN